MRGTGAGPGTAAIAAPARWPSAWPALWPVLASRAVFVAMIAVLTAVGLSLAGDPVGTWWLPFIPAVLLLGPAVRIQGTPRRWERAAVTHRMGLEPGRLRPAGPRAVYEPDSARPERDRTWVPARYAGQPALLARHRRDRAVLLAGGEVQYVPRHWLRKRLG